MTGIPSTKIGLKIALTLANAEKLTKTNRNGLKKDQKWVNGIYNEPNITKKGSIWKKLNKIRA